jgi:hypothetical protein
MGFHKPAWFGAAAVLVVGGIAGLYWFQPWKLVVDQRVDEALLEPVPLATAPSADPGTTAPAEPASPVLVAEGEFVSHEHTTTGTARIVRNPDGSHRLELVDLDTSNGPDLRVWLTDQPVVDGRAGWHVFDDGRWVELGRLKGNQGSQAYDLPEGVDPTDYTSVSVWCKRFSVSFGAAVLTGSSPPAS